MTPAMMRAAVIDAFGPPDALVVRQLPVPAASVGQVLVRVVTAGVQLTDAAVRAGWTPPGASIEFPQTLGNEFAGVVEATGTGVNGFDPGDPVLGFNVLNCYAEFVVVPASHLVRKPDSLGWDAAGALSASGQTAHTAMQALRVSAADTVLVHGAAGGVGSMFIQLAVLQGATVIGTASPDNHEYLRQLGAVPVAYGDGQIDRIRTAARGPLTVAFDAAGHENLRAAIDLVDDRRRIATIVDMQLATELGCRVIRSDRSAGRLETLVDLAAAEKLGVHVRRRYPLQQAASAHRDVETGHGRGKVVLTIGGRP